MKKTVSLVLAIIMAACLASVIVSADVDPEIVAYGPENLSVRCVYDAETVAAGPEIEIVAGLVIVQLSAPFRAQRPHDSRLTDGTVPGAGSPLWSI